LGYISFVPEVSPIVPRPIAGELISSWLPRVSFANSLILAELVQGIEAPPTPGYAEAYRNGERISTAHVESTVNQLINWRMCKKHQMGWSRAGAQQLLHVKTAIINGRLDRYTGHHSVPADIAA
jgi:hypothetical protein